MNAINVMMLLSDPRGAWRTRKRFTNSKRMLGVSSESRVRPAVRSPSVGDCVVAVEDTIPADRRAMARRPPRGPYALTSTGLPAHGTLTDKRPVAEAPFSSARTARGY